MAKKNQYFKTSAEVSKTMQSALMESVISAGVAVGGAFGMKAISNKVQSENTRKMIGAGVAVIGTGLNIYAKDPNIKAGALGLIGVGAVQAVHDLSTKASEKMAGSTLKGLGATNQDFTNEGAIPDEILEQMALEAEQSFETEDTPETTEDQINGIEQTPVLETPEDIDVASLMI